jgi:hypothetical protein
MENFNLRKFLVENRKKINEELTQFYTMGDKIETNLTPEEVSRFKNEIWYQLSIYTKVVEQGLIHTTKGKLNKEISQIVIDVDGGGNISNAKILFK